VREVGDRRAWDLGFLALAIAQLFGGALLAAGVPTAAAREPELKPA
jgi:hypothetical protein